MGSKRHRLSNPCEVRYVSHFSGDVLLRIIDLREINGDLAREALEMGLGELPIAWAARFEGADPLG